MPSNGSFWYGKSIGFPGFLYKKNIGVGAKKSTKMGPGGLCTNSTNINNKYIPGSGIGGNSIATRRAKMRLATSCNANQNCGKFYPQLGTNWQKVSPYTIN